MLTTGPLKPKKRNTKLTLRVHLLPSVAYLTPTHSFTLPPTLPYPTLPLRPTFIGRTSGQSGQYSVVKIVSSVTVIVRLIFNPYSLPVYL
jgi:hypothetical protein